MKNPKDRSFPPGNADGERRRCRPPAVPERGAQVRRHEGGVRPAPQAVRRPARLSRRHCLKAGGDPGGTRLLAEALRGPGPREERSAAREERPAAAVHRRHTPVGQRAQGEERGQGATGQGG